MFLKIIILSLSLICLNSNLVFAKKEFPPLLQKIEKKYSSAKTLSVDFTQLNWSEMMKQTKESSGTIFFKKPFKIRWETLAPQNSLLVSNGNLVWFYTPPFSKDQPGQVIKKHAHEIQSQIAHALLSGQFSMARDMKIEKKDETTFILTPKPNSAGTVLRAILTIDPQKLVISKVALEHKGGNRVEISLNNIQLGLLLNESLFRFTPPANTDFLEP